MEEKQICCGSVFDRLPPLSANYPWFVGQNLEGENDQTQVQIFYNLVSHDHYRCRIPELVGKRIRGCFHGWVILSHNLIWSLWNPVTSKSICLPPLVHNDIEDCCLSSPPNDPSSVLLLTRLDQPTFVFCSLHCKKKRLKWSKMSYAKQLTSITGVKDGFLSCLTCCNRKVYALATGSDHVVQVGITVTKGRQVAIKLFLFSKFGGASLNGCSAGIQYLEGSCTELFSLLIGFKDKDDTMETIHAVRLFKLDMTNRIWEELDDLKDTLFSVDFTSKYSVLYSPAITTSSELGAGGYIHILRVKGNIVYSYHVKDKTISVSCMPACLVGTSHVSAWAMPVNTLVRPRTSEEYQVKDKEDDDDDDIAIMEDAEESQLLLSIPFDVLKIIMEFCVGVEYLKFRATCKQCRLAAPPLMIQWSKETASKFVNSPWPWLMVFEQHQGEGVITFTDPLFGDRYFIKTPQELSL